MAPGVDKYGRYGSDFALGKGLRKFDSSSRYYNYWTRTPNYTDGTVDFYVCMVYET